MADTDKLTEDEGQYLLSVARDTIEQKLFDQEEQKQSDTDLPTKFFEQRGTFVTLTTGGNLRGCIGHIIPQETLIEGIRVNAINAAFRDPRFPPFNKEEWKSVKIEISILTDPKPLSYSDSNDLLRKLQPGIDGVSIFVSRQDSGKTNGEVGHLKSPPIRSRPLRNDPQIGY